MDVITAGETQRGHGTNSGKRRRSETPLATSLRLPDREKPERSSLSSVVLDALILLVALVLSRQRPHVMMGSDGDDDDGGDGVEDEDDADDGGFHRWRHCN